MPISIFNRIAIVNNEPSYEVAQMYKIDLEGLRNKYESEKAETLCLYYDTILKLMENYAKFRQLNPQVQLYKDKYDELYYVESILREIITEKLVSC